MNDREWMHRSCECGHVDRIHKGGRCRGWVLSSTGRWPCNCTSYVHQPDIDLKANPVRLPYVRVSA